MAVVALTDITGTNTAGRGQFNGDTPATRFERVRGLHSELPGPVESVPGDLVPDRQH
jgi:hypothetical protein